MSSEAVPSQEKREDVTAAQHEKVLLITLLLDL